MRPVVLVLLAACGVAPSDDGADSEVDTEVEVEPVTVCPDGLPIVPWDPVGPYGTSRHDLADDLVLDRADGTTWRLSEAWDGCSSFVFLPDTLPVSDQDPSSLWVGDLGGLVKASPHTVTYVFVSRLDGADARASIDAMQQRVDKVVGNLDPEQAAHWADRLVVAKKPVGKLDGWLHTVMGAGIGQLGFGVDRFQALRGVGSLSDVTRQASGAQWPWEANLAYAAHEVEHFDVEAARQARLDIDGATVVDLWGGELLTDGFAEKDVELPSAEVLAGFDTLEIDADLRCPDATKPEIGNCGAWDYLVHLWVQDGDGWIELGRFITSYHRETRWVVDVTPSLVHLLQGGTRHFKWEWAPPWNTQPTVTRVSLRFGKQGRGVRPTASTHLWTGGSFGSAYDDGHEDQVVPVPASARRVELWMLLTGHGGGTNNCSEFCNHQHRFTVNGHEHLVEFPMVGDPTGCFAMIADGATPNQWGTWWFGRGGWCPGAAVQPIAIDVTDEVTKGADATLAYRGLFQGGTPPDGSGDIDLESWLVVYE
jgi:hypothetical protein